MPILKISSNTSEPRDYEVGQPYLPDNPEFGKIVRIERTIRGSFEIHNEHGGTTVLVKQYVDLASVVYGDPA